MSEFNERNHSQNLKTNKGIMAGASGLGVMTLPLRDGNSYGLKEGIIIINDEVVEEYLIKRELSGISKRHLYLIRMFLKHYLKYVDYRITQNKTLEYFSSIKNQFNVSYYRKQMYQILKFLKYIGVEWIKDINPPKEPEYIPKRVTIDDVKATLEYFESSPYFKQIKALILLAATSGLRAEELYQLTPDDIDLNNRIVYVRHNPKEGKTTKTGKSRIAFFSRQAQQALVEYLQFFNNGCKLKHLFGKTHIQRLFRNAPLSVKDLRKFFSQEWERLNGSYAVKELLVGHSIKRSVDLQHYTYLDESDLKKIYDRVFGEYEIE